MTNRVTRKNKRERYVHINMYITRRTFDYFDQQPNMSAAIRDVLDAYVANQPNSVVPTNEEQTDESKQCDWVEDQAS